jgi:hypothetical protein
MPLAVGGSSLSTFQFQNVGVVFRWKRVNHVGTHNGLEHQWGDQLPAVLIAGPYQRAPNLMQKIQSIFDVVIVGHEQHGIGHDRDLVS